MELAAVTQAKLTESIVLHGDISGLSPAQKAEYYIAQCTRMGLDPHTQPLAFLKFQGKEVLYAGRGATDQLRRIHGVSRRIIDGPKVLTVEGVKVLYAVCEATYKGCTETSTATLPATDLVTGLMKVETKAKRRATLSILGLGWLDEMEAETLFAEGAEPLDVPTITRAATVQPQQLPKPANLAERFEACADLTAVTDLYRGLRGSEQREPLTDAAVKRLEALGTKNAKNVLGGAVRSDDAAEFFSHSDPESQARTFCEACSECVSTVAEAVTLYREMNARLNAEHPRALDHARALLHDRLLSSGVEITATELQKHLAAGLSGGVPAPPWAKNRDAVQAQAASYPHANAVINGCVKRGRENDLGEGRCLGWYAEACAARLVALSAGELQSEQAQAMVAQAIAKGREARKENKTSATVGNASGDSQ